MVSIKGKTKFGGLIGGVLLAAAFSLAGCTDDLAEGRVLRTLQDSIDASIHYQGILSNYTRPAQSRVAMSKPGANKQASFFDDLPLQPTWLSRCPIDSVSNWYNMEDHQMSIAIGDAVYDNFYVNKTGEISASMGPFLYDDGTMLLGNTEAWFPNTGHKKLDTFVVKKNQSFYANIEHSDLLYGRLTSGTSEIQFHHKMTQVELHISILRTYTDGTTVDTIPSHINSVKIANCYTAGKVRPNPPADFTYLGGGITVDSASLDTITLIHYKDSDRYIANDAGDTIDTVFCYKGIIFPEKQPLKIIMDVSGKIYEGAVQEYTFKDGALYNVIVNLNEQMDFKIGDYLCANEYGEIEFSTLANIPSMVASGFYPVAVIFSYCPSYEDQARGWNRGYAMSLSNVNNPSEYQWSRYTDRYAQKVHYGMDYTKAIKYRNGYDETHHIVDNTSYVYADYPAFFATVNWTPTYNPDKEYTSGWFLPSIGQWYEFLMKLGRPNNLNVQNNGSYLFWPGTIGTVKNNLNAYVNAVKPYTNNVQTFYDYNHDRYWTSTESDSYYSLDAYFWDQGMIFYDREYHKGYSFRVRPCIAF